MQLTNWENKRNINDMFCVQKERNCEAIYFVRIEQNKKWNIPTNVFREMNV